jgi:NitT/TauT family transport system substrate-binding protein
MNYRAVIRVIICLSMIFAVLPWGAAEAQVKKAPLTKITVLVPGPSAIGTLNFWVAVGEGYFKDEGLECNWEAVDGSSQVLQGLAAGKAQIGRPGPGPLLAARGRGLDAVFLYNLYPKSQFGLVVKEKSSYKVPRDLKGRVIGVGTADGGEAAFIRSVLTDAGMKEGADYTFLVVGDGGMAAAAFIRGDIEAYAASLFDAATITVRGVSLREITPEKFLSYFGSGFVAMAPYIKENPDVIKGFGRAIVRGTRFAMDKANRKKVLQYCQKGNPQEGEETALASALIDNVLDRITPLDMSNGWGYSRPADWKVLHESSLASGFLKAPLPNLESVYTNEFVKIWNGKP